MGTDFDEQPTTNMLNKAEHLNMLNMRNMLNMLKMLKTPQDSAQC